MLQNSSVTLTSPKIPKDLDVNDPLVKFALEKVGHAILTGESISIPEELRPGIDPETGRRPKQYEVKHRLVLITRKIWG